MKYPRCERYYSSLSDDFVKAEERGEIKREYKELTGIRRILSFVLYRLVATPVAFLHSALALRQRVKGRELLRGRRGYILVINHTEVIGDAFLPSVISFPKRASVIVHPDNLSGALGKFTRHLGAIPTPEGVRDTGRFLAFVSSKLKKGEAVAVYPEAHVWEKYTGIRELDSGAFYIAVREGCPVFSATRVYKRSRLFGYKTRVYVDGPFMPDASLPKRAATELLAQAVRDKMTERASESDVEIIKYIKKESEVSAEKV